MSKRRMAVLTVAALVVLAGCKSAVPATTLNFDHPRLQELAKSSPIMIQESDRIDWKNVSYFAVVVRPRVTPGREFSQPARLLLFRRHWDKTTLIWESRPQYYISLYSGDGFRGGQLRGKEFEGVAENGFADRNRNNLPDLAFAVSHGGGNSSDVAGVMILELTGKGRVIDITPRTEFNPSGLLDVDNDGKAEIIATRHHDSDFGSEAHAGSPYESRVYEWQGNSYKDASAKFSGYYDRKSADLEDVIKAMYNRPFVSGEVSPRLVQMFFNYEATRRSKQGWERVLAVGDLKNWASEKLPAGEVAKYRIVLERLKKRVK